MMRKLWFILLMNLLPLSAYAGDCWSHPMFIHDLEINSCERISKGNAALISRGAIPKKVAALYPGLILEGVQKAMRQIDLDEPGRGVKFKVYDWQKRDEKVVFLYQLKNLPNCSAFAKGSRVKLASYRNCGCDTGPAANGYCALTVEKVTKIPNEYLQYGE